MGSRGDVQPYIALGTGLRQAGHRVRIATYDKFQAPILKLGLEFSPIDSELSFRAAKLEGKGRIDWFRSAWRLNKLLPCFAERLWRDTLRACQGTEAIIYGFIASLMGHCAAEKLGVPCIATSIYPVIGPTRAFPNLLFPALPLGGRYNWVTHQLFYHGIWQILRSFYSYWKRQNPELPRFSERPYGSLRGKPVPILYAYSPAVVAPKPPQWSDGQEVTGYWFLDNSAGWQPADDLAHFLASGPPPVYVGFGSMNLLDPQKVTEIVLEALARTGQRGLLLEGWGGLGNVDLPDEVFQVKSAPHDWLFPQMAAVVHHGGSGTTAASLRAGVPSIVVPFTADQPFWGKRVYELGVGPKPIPRKRLSVERLAAAIAAATSDQIMQQRAAALGQRIRAENGVAQAVEVIHRHLGHWPKNVREGSRYAESGRSNKHG